MGLGSLKVSLTCKDHGEKGIEYLSLLHGLCTMSPTYSAVGQCCATHTFATYAYRAALLDAFTSLTKFNSWWPLASLAPFLHTQCLYTPPRLPVPFATSCTTSFLCLSFVRRNFFMHAVLLPPLFDLLHGKMDNFWAWRRWFLKIIMFDWTLL